MGTEATSASIQTELLELKSFVLAIMTLATSEPPLPEIKPCTVLDEHELRAPKTSLKGWRMAINDCIEMSSHWPADRVKEVDTALRAAGFVSLSAVRRRYSKRCEAMLNRGRIRGQVEYYAAVALLADSSSNLSQAERASLEHMVVSYEQSAA